MNTNKKYDGWILCPSQSFPGKFYYFNVLNGEAAWSLNEAELQKKDVKRDSFIENIAEKSHCYPEPDSPPIDESPNVSPISPNNKKPHINNVGPKLTTSKVTHTPTPVFGEAVFPKYVSNVAIPNVIWTPIQVPTSMFIPQEVKKQTLDQVTQTVELDKDIFVQSCAVPLCKRFLNYEKPILNFNKDNKIENQNDLPKLYSSTPTKYASHLLDRNEAKYFFGQIKPGQVDKKNQMRPLIKEPVLKSYINSKNCQKQECINTSKSLSDLFTKQSKTFKHSVMVIHDQEKSIDFNINQYKNSEKHNSQICDNYFTQEFNKTRRHSETIVSFSETQNKGSEGCHQFTNISTPLEKDIKNLHMRSLNPNLGLNANNENINPEKHGITQDNNIMKLDRNDLRLLLVARKRKLTDTETNNNGSFEEKKIKSTYIEESRPVTPKKRVTFDVDNESDGNEEQNETFPSTSKLPSTQSTKSPIFQTLRDLAKYPVRTDVWYIVADTDILLDDFEFIENLVKSDDNCRLLMPHAVHADIVALATGDCCGRRRVFVARQIARRMALPPRHIVVQSAECEEATSMFTIDSILDCSLEAIHQKYHVILITNDIELQTKAKSLDIHCYNMQEIRSFTSTFTPEVTFDLKKIQITVENNAKVTQNNLFLQKNINSYLFDNKYEFPVHSVKQRLFDDVANGKSDKLIDITKPKHPNNNVTQSNKKSTLNYESDTTGTSTEIGRDIQKMNLKGNIMVKPNKETGDSNKNITQTVYDFQKLNEKENLLNLKKEVKNNKVFAKQNQIPNSNENRTFQHKDTFNHKVKVPNSNNEKDIPNSVVSSHFFQHGLNQTTFDNSKIRNSFLNSNEKLENVNQPTTNTNRAANKLKNLNELSMDIKLKKFYIKDRETEKRIMTRIDEWICCFTQIIEESLSNVLRENHFKSELTPPWTLHEAMQCVRTMYSDNEEVCMIIDSFNELTSEHSCGKGYLKTSMKPNDFMKIIGCGILLMQALKTCIRNHQELTEAEIALKNIIKLLENPSLDPKLPQSAPVLCRFDKALEGEARQNFVKEPSDIIMYLKKHYIQWISYDDITDDNNYLKEYKQYQLKRNENVNIVRTFGKDIGLLKIDKSKIMTVGKQTDEAKQFVEPKVIRLLENDRDVISNKTDNDKLDIPVMNTIKYPSAGPRVIRIMENLRSQKETKDLETKTNNTELPKLSLTYDQKQTKTELKVMIKLDNINKFNFPTTKDKPISFADDLNVPKHENTFKQSEVTDGLTVVRNMKLIDAFEKKLKNKPVELDLDILDYSEIDNDGDDISDQTITNQSASEDMSNIINDLNISNNTGVNTKVHEVVKNDSGFNNNYCDNNYTDSTCNEIDSKNNNVNSISNKFNYRDNNGEHRVNNTSFCNNSDSRTSRDALLLNDDDYTPSNDSTGINDKHTDLKYQNNNKVSIINNGKSNDDQVNDSGIESESVHAYPLAKSFLTEMSKSLKIIHRFIETSVTDIRSKDFGEEKKRQLHNKANRTHQCVNEIIYNLKSIIDREASGGTSLKQLLIKAGVQVTTDKRMAKYRQVVRKCLEQTQILRNALKTLLAVTDADFEATTSVTTESISSSIRFLNIFE